MGAAPTVLAEVQSSMVLVKYGDGTGVDRFMEFPRENRGFEELRGFP